MRSSVQIQNETEKAGVLQYTGIDDIHELKMIFNNYKNVKIGVVIMVISLYKNAMIMVREVFGF